MFAPTGSPWALNWISRYLPNRDELLFRNVFALPKDSNSGLVASTMSFISWIEELLPPDTFAIYCIIRFAASVLPAPDSPEMITHWLSLYAFML